MLGTSESGERFLTVALYQVPHVCVCKGMFQCMALPDCVAVSVHRREHLCSDCVCVLSARLRILGPESLMAMLLTPCILTLSIYLSLSLCLYLHLSSLPRHCTVTQGTPKVDTQFMLAKAGAEAIVKTAEQMHKKPEPDATIFATRCATVSDTLPCPTNSLVSYCFHLLRLHFSSLHHSSLLISSLPFTSLPFPPPLFSSLPFSLLPFPSLSFKRRRFYCFSRRYKRYYYQH